MIGGVERTIHFFAIDLPHTDAGFVQAYPAEATEAFCAGHVAAFAFFSGVPASILYDNTKLADCRRRFGDRLRGHDGRWQSFVRDPHTGAFNAAAELGERA